jgi:16S rRNA (adenine1518-N6/adenine1519-N6)-dimethyltransferase
MPLQEDIQRQLQSRGLSPVKYRGQNFLVSKEDLSAIAAAAAPQEKETIVEVGAGVGNLTDVLRAHRAPIIAVEKDAALASLLRERFRNQSALTVREGDILTETKFPARYVLVGNIPYYLTGALLRKFLIEAEIPPRRIVLTIQKEVAARITATPPHATFLSTMVSLFGEAQMLRTIPPTHFWPPPKVSSAVVRIDLRSLPRAERNDTLRLLAFIKTGFRQPRKTLLNNLAGFYPRKQVSEAIANIKLDPKSRPHDLSTAQWRTLQKHLDDA